MIIIQPDTTPHHKHIHPPAYQHPSFLPHTSHLSIKNYQSIVHNNYWIQFYLHFMCELFCLNDAPAHGKQYPP